MKIHASIINYIEKDQVPVSDVGGQVKTLKYESTNPFYHLKTHDSSL